MKKNVAILLFDEVEVLDFAGPFEVFTVTNELSSHTTLNVFTFAQAPGTVRACNGLKVVPDYTVENCPMPNLLVIPGGFGTRALLNKPALLEWLRIKARTAEIVMSVCTGSLVLAKAGLLDGLEATTHHERIDMLREISPKVKVTPEARFTDNGRICTAAGITAGIDLSLHVVARLFNRDTAAKTARYMEYPFSP